VSSTVLFTLPFCLVAPELAIAPLSSIPVPYHLYVCPARLHSSRASKTVATLLGAYRDSAKMIWSRTEKLSPVAKAIMASS
jgi:hypothetical protein